MPNFNVRSAVLHVGLLGLLSSGCIADETIVSATNTERITPVSLSTPIPRNSSSTLRPLDFRGVAANSYFMSQMQDRRWNPKGPAWSLNCAPAALAMALKALGMPPPGAKPDDDPETLIRLTRLAIDGSTDEQRIVLFDNVEKGAVACGLKAKRLYKLPAIQKEMARGRFIILIGDPTVYTRRLSDNEYMKSVGAHIVLLTAISGDMAWINDPLSRVGGLPINLDELAQVISYNNWYQGISLWTES